MVIEKALRWAYMMVIERAEQSASWWAYMMVIERAD